MSRIYKDFPKIKFKKQPNKLMEKWKNIYLVFLGNPQKKKCKK